MSKVVPEGPCGVDVSGTWHSRARRDRHVRLFGRFVGRPLEERITYGVDVQDVSSWGAPMEMCGGATRMLPSPSSNALLFYTAGLKHPGKKIRGKTVLM